MRNREKIFTEFEIEYLNDYLDKAGFFFKDRHYNVLNTYWNTLDKFKEKTLYISKLEKKFNLNFMDIYALEYRQGSETLSHKDNSIISIITCLKKENLVGGDTLIWKSKEAWVQGKPPAAIDHNQGESIWYKKDMHGVSLVTQGIRRVLVVWLK